MRTMEFKAAVLGAGDGDLEDGEVLALVSAFNNVDSYGDVVIPGAFAKTLAQWDKSGDPLPFIWSHDWSDPFAHVGIVRAAEETDAGLKVRAYISPEEREQNPKAAQVYRLLKARRVTQFSFAFDVIDGGEGDREGRWVYELRELKLYEVGPCLIGVNQETELIAAKAARLRGVGLNPKARKALEDAQATITQILAPLGDPEPPAAKAAGSSGQDGTPAAGDTPDRVPGAAPASKGFDPASAEIKELIRNAQIAASGSQDGEE